jgi:hypothetical protein
MTIKEFYARELSYARNRLSEFAKRQAEATEKVTGRYWVPSPDAPNTFEHLLAYRDVSYLPVFDWSSETTIYADDEGFQSFMFWHDSGHMMFDHDFTPTGERTLQQLHHIRPARRGLGYETFAYRLYLADTVGRFDYISRNHKLPDNELNFCLAWCVHESLALKTQTFIGI